MQTNQPVDIVTIISGWLSTELSEYYVIPAPITTTNPNCWLAAIVYKGLGYQAAAIYNTYIEVGIEREPLRIEICDPQLFPLLSNRLHMMALGFRKALSSRPSISSN